MLKDIRPVNDSKPNPSIWEVETPGSAMIPTRPNLTGYLLTIIEVVAALSSSGQSLMWFLLLICARRF
jgi:hypothetical protein